MKAKLAIIDSRVCERVRRRFGLYAEEVLPFKTEGVTYNSISCHPDIFLYQDEDGMVVAPNAPISLKKALLAHEVDFREGRSAVGSAHEDSCFYNCVSTERFFFHRRGFTDSVVLERNRAKQFVDIKQSYTRCSMLHLCGDRFITSDAGIFKTLKGRGVEVLLFPPEGIEIADHRYGFLGGTCGKYCGCVFFLGNPLRHSLGAELISFIERSGFEVVSLCDSMLYDGGGIFMI